MIITFDLTNPGQNYEPVIQKIMGLGEAIRLGTNAFLLGTERNPVEIRNEIIPEMSPGDKLYVGGVAMNAAWFGIPTGSSDSIRAIFDRYYSSQSGASTATPQPKIPA